MLKGVTILCNYPNDEAEAAVPTEMTVDQLCQVIQKLFYTEKDMTSFVITAAIAKPE